MLGEANALERAIDRKIAKAAGKRTRTTGTVTRTATDGTIYVRVDGADSDTPVSSSTASVSTGDSVTVRIENGRAAIEGNATDPSAGTASVRDIGRKADGAVRDAQRANAAANAAEQDAQRAHDAADEAQESADAAAQAASIADGKAVAAATAASNAQSSADAAQSSATQANTYALGALAGLSTLESVVDTVQWFADHRTATADTAVVAGKDYYAYDAATGTLSKVKPEGGENPSQEGWYELDETIQNYVVSHVAETDDGLYVLSLDNGWRVLVSGGAGDYAAGVHVIDPQGNVAQSTTASGVDFSAGKSWHVGSNDAYILYTPASGNDPATITIGGANIRLGDTHTLSELISDSTRPDFDVSQSWSDGTYTLSAHVHSGVSDVTDLYDPEFFTWWLKDESGESYYASGKTVTVSESALGYRNDMLCAFEEYADFGLVDSGGDGIVTGGGDTVNVQVWR